MVSAPLERKLEKLLNMLAVTEKVGEDPFNLDLDAARQFEAALTGLVREIEELDRALPPGGESSESFTREEAALEKRIQETLRRLEAANRRLVTAIRARQEIIGKKILRLKSGKDFLDSSRSGIDPEPGLIDSTI